MVAAGNEFANMKEWIEVAIGDLIGIEHGYAFKGQSIHDDPQDQSDILLTPGNFAIGGGFKGDKFKYYDGDAPEGFVLHPNDLLVTMTDLSKQSDTLGYPALVPSRTDNKRYLHNQRLGKIKLKETNDVEFRYLYYVMCSRDYRNEILASCTGTTVKHTSPERIKQYRFLLPPKEEQQAIAHVLGTLDDKIELNRRMNRTLEAIAQAIFQDWFVDFGPARAKMEGQEPYLPPELWDMFPDELVDSELGEIPAAWERKTVKDCFELTMGQSPPGSTYNDHGDGMPFFQGSTDFGSRFPTNRRFCSAPTRVAQMDDTLVSVRAPIGDMNVAWEECCIGRGVAALRHKSGASSFTYYSSQSMKPEIKVYEQAGTVFGAITKNQFESVPVLDPNPIVLEQFEAIVRPLAQRIRSGTGAIADLTAQRDTLLPKLISGEMRPGQRSQ